MLRIILLLLGTKVARNWWFIPFLFSLLFIALGLLCIYDAYQASALFPLDFFGYLLLIDGLMTLVFSVSGLSPINSKLRYAKSAIAITLAFFIIEDSPESAFVLALTFGVLFLFAGLVQTASSWVVRFKTWRLSLTSGLLQIVIGFIFFIPEPIPYEGTVPLAVGILILIMGVNAIELTWRLSRLTHNKSILSLWQPAGTHWSGVHHQRQMQPAFQYESSQHSTNAATGQSIKHTLVVHIWTATATAKTKTRNLPLVNRYIAAVDINGVVSTGHAALEASNGVYISLYPDQEIDRSPTNFAERLRATSENNVKGRFLPSYKEEAAAWCDSTAKIVFRQFNLQQLNTFWHHYQLDTTYNLTRRNCSSTVAHALDAALDGVLRQHRRPLRTLFRAVVTPELWIAGQIYRQASTMAWTPGLVRDYARALRIVVDPPPPIKWMKPRSHHH